MMEVYKDSNKSTECNVNVQPNDHCSLSGNIFIDEDDELFNDPVFWDAFEKIERSFIKRPMGTRNRDMPSFDLGIDSSQTSPLNVPSPPIVSSPCLKKRKEWDPGDIIQSIRRSPRLVNVDSECVIIGT